MRPVGRWVRSPRTSYLLVGLCSLGLCVAIPNAPAAQNPEISWVLRGVTVIDGTGADPVADAEILVRGERIACVAPAGGCQVPADAETLDRPGHHVIPGLWNTHAHLTQPNQYLYMAEKLPPGVADRLSRAILRIYLASGVTGVVSLIDDPDRTRVLRNAERHGELIAPRLFSCGGGISYPGSWNALPYSATPTTAEAAREAVREGAGAGVDCIKITVESGPGVTHDRPRMPFEIVQAIVEEAHRLRLPVFAHTTHAAEMRDAVRAGVDVVTHAVFDTLESGSELLEEVRENRVYHAPTLVLYESFFRHFDDPDAVDEPFLRSRLTPEMYRALTDPARRQRFREGFTEITGGLSPADARAMFSETLEMTRRILEAGGRPLVGTDPVFFVVPGHDVHRELEWLVEVGLSPLEAIRAATLDAARVMGRESDFGTIEPGKHADFVVLAGDPLAEITNTRTIDFVAKAGQIYNATMLLGTVRAGQ